MGGFEPVYFRQPSYRITNVAFYYGPLESHTIVNGESVILRPAVG